MEERTLIVGKTSKRTTTILLKIGLVMIGIGLLLFFLTVKSSWRMAVWLECDWEITFSDYLVCLGDCISFTNGPVILVSILLDMGIILSIYSLILWLSIKDNSITVTNRRVYGVTKWNKRVDLPLNQISAVSTNWLKGIAVGTSSGKIIFKAIENYIDVHKEITNLLATKQDTPTNQSVKENSGNSVDDLKKYKELLDSGVLTQEEFDAKKKQLLGL